MKPHALHAVVSLKLSDKGEANQFVSIVFKVFGLQVLNTPFGNTKFLQYFPGNKSKYLYDMMILTYYYPILLID